MLPDVLDINPSGSNGGNGREGVNKMGSFRNGVYNNHDTVFTVCFRQLGNEVDTDYIPRCIWNQKGMEFTNWRTMDCLST